MNVLKMKKKKPDNSDGKFKTLRVEDLTMAIINSTDREGMKDEAARRMAQHIMNFFGYSDRIIDNILEPEDRDVFYILEDNGLLTTEREETTLYDGREWRIHYWLFRKNKIMALAQEERTKETEEEAVASIYNEIPDDIWSFRES